MIAFICPWHRTVKVLPIQPGIGMEWGGIEACSCLAAPSSMASACALAARARVAFLKPSLVLVALAAKLQFEVGAPAAICHE